MAMKCYDIKEKCGLCRYINRNKYPGKAVCYETEDRPAGSKGAVTVSEHKSACRVFMRRG
jgi:hypothetical protein